MLGLATIAAVDRHAAAGSQLPAHLLSKMVSSTSIGFYRQGEGREDGVTASRLQKQSTHQVVLRLGSSEASLLGLQMTTFPVSSNEPSVCVCEHVYVYVCMVSI